MANNQILKLLIIPAIIVFLAFAGCEKMPDPDIQTVKDQTKAAMVVSDAFSVANGHSTAEKMMSEYPDCISHSWNDSHEVLTISFDNCEFNGVQRNGAMIVSFTAEWGQSAEMAIEFDNYSVDGNTVSGTVNATFAAVTEEGRKFTISAENMILTTPDEKTITWSSSIEYQMTSGFITFFNPYDDAYTLNGSGEGVNSNGEEFETQYNNVVRKGDCKWPVSGTITITKTDADPIELDFDQDGNADCDNIVKVTQSGVSLNIEL